MGIKIVYASEWYQQVSFYIMTVQLTNGYPYLLYSNR